MLLLTLINEYAFDSHDPFKLLSCTIIDKINHFSHLMVVITIQFGCIFRHTPMLKRKNSNDINFTRVRQRWKMNHRSESPLTNSQQMNNRISVSLQLRHSMIRHENLVWKIMSLFQLVWMFSNEPKRYQSPFPTFIVEISWLNANLIHW